MCVSLIDKMPCALLYVTGDKALHHRLKHMDQAWLGPSLGQGGGFMWTLSAQVVRKYPSYRSIRGFCNDFTSSAINSESGCLYIVTYRES